MNDVELDKLQVLVVMLLQATVDEALAVTSQCSCWPCYTYTATFDEQFGHIAR